MDSFGDGGVDIMIEIKSPYTQKIISLLPCPFCGSNPEMKFIGNEYTTKRSVKIICNECRISRTDSALKFGFEWLENVAAEYWNARRNTATDEAQS